jgi:hypothetical protein
MTIVEGAIFEVTGHMSDENIRDSRLGLLFNPDNRGDTFLQNMCELLVNYIALQPEDHTHGYRYEDLKCKIFHYTND